LWFLRIRAAAMTETYQPTPSEIAVYIERMAGELASLARTNRLEMLAYLLDVAREEAVARIAETKAAHRR
jgi:hypothetical protein